MITKTKRVMREKKKKVSSNSWDSCFLNIFGYTTELAMEIEHVDFLNN